ncbi:hypothetical protein RB195_017454 [Necator americanus]|uniref:Uncharacterized protein n=1 Tax=Necator americanus TaxID=51031 RepID=A0ABR1C5B3_NECAM
MLKEKASDNGVPQTSLIIMPFLYGAVVSSGLKYRFVIALLLVYIVYSHWRHNNDLMLIIEKAGNDLTSCQNYAESLVAKLRVVFEHKSKMEKIFNSKRIASQGKMKAAEVMWRSCEENLTLVAAQLADCQNSKEGQIAQPENADITELQSEIAALKAVNASLTEVVLRKEEAMQGCSKEMLRLRKSLSSCEDMMKKYVGAVPVAHYTQNETAFFERKHKAGDALAFDRNPEAFKRVTLLPAKELVAKLAEKARHMRRGEEADKHPDDREKNDESIDESHHQCHRSVAFVHFS